MALKKLCDSLGLLFGRCKDKTKAILTDKGVPSPSQEKLMKAMDKEIMPSLFTISL
jgi:hypothetical protein